MKIFVIGGATVQQGDPEFQSQLGTLDAAMERLGEDIAAAGHDLVACSPFPGSADVGAIRGASRVLRASARPGPAIEIHCPNASTVLSAVTQLVGAPLPPYFRVYNHPISTDSEWRTQWEYTWLLSQLSALETCQAVVALGGKPAGAANLLLTLAATRSKHILPLAFLGGAAAQSLQNLQWPLDDLFKGRIASLYQSDCINDALPLVEELASRRHKKAGQGLPLRLFVSYPRSRPEEADFVEMTLRRRHFDVYRDERDFGAGRDLPHEILAHIDRSSIFVVIWCKEYACSPWCHDEFDYALRRHGVGTIELWILCVDETRIVPPAARTLVTYPARTRDEIERHLLVLLERAQSESLE